MADKRLKIAIGARLHPIKIGKLREYCKDNDTSIQRLIEAYVDSLIVVTEEEKEAMRVKRSKKTETE